MRGAGLPASQLIEPRTPDRRPLRIRRPTDRWAIPLRSRRLGRQYLSDSDRARVIGEVAEADPTGSWIKEIAAERGQTPAHEAPL